MIVTWPMQCGFEIKSHYMYNLPSILFPFIILVAFVEDNAIMSLMLYFVQNQRKKNLLN